MGVNRFTTQGSLLLFILQIFTLQVHAQAKMVEIGIGTRYTVFNYVEELSPPSKSTESAAYSSLLGEGRLYVMENTYFQLSYEDSRQVNSNYDGADLNTGAPIKATNPLSFRGYEGDFFLALGPVTAYLGYGNRKWDRFLSGTPGYREIYTWNYSNVGIQYWFIRNGNLDIGIDGCLRTTNGAKIKVITSETVTGGADSQMGLGSRKGYRLSAPIIFRHDAFAFSAAPFFELSQIGQSNVVTNRTLAPTPGTGIQEPGSHTHQYGMELLLSFAL